MARFVIDIPDDLNEEFRIKVLKTHGSKKGALTQAVIEALRLWIESQK